MQFTIYGLTTEYAVNPINLFTDTPRFSWKLQAYPDFRQKSYRIVVATTKENLQKGTYDLWDSGAVYSRQNVAVQYAGRTLHSRDEGYWKCIVEDENGQCAESDVASFEIALLHSSDWHGQWQSTPLHFHGKAQYWRAPHCILSKPVRRARAYVCGLGYHEFYVNGNKIGKALLSPAPTDYGKRVLYSTYDITDALLAGENCFGFILGHGWFGAKKLLFQLYVDYTDGTQSEFYSMHHAGYWRASEGPVQENSIYHGETYDARKEAEIEGWCTYGFRADYDNNWAFTDTTDAPAGVLTSQTAEPIEVTEDVSAKEIYTENNRKIFALDANIAGWMRFSVRGERGAKVTVRYAEKINKDGTALETVNLRTAKATDVYILKGEGVETYEPRFTYHGFVYAEFIMEGAVELLSTVGRFVRTATERISQFRCSDEILNRLHRNAVITECANMHGILTDCPQRDERFQWLNDITSRTYQQVNNFNMARLYPKVLHDIADTQRQDGAIADTAPFGIGRQPADPISAAFLLLAKACYRQYGDKRIVEELYPRLKKWVDYLTSRSENHLLEYSYYGDWVMPYPPEDSATPENAKTPGAYMSATYYFWQVKLLSELAKIIDNRADAKSYAALAEAIKTAVNKQYFDENTCNYCTGSQTSNAVALSLDICAPQHRAHVAKNVADSIVDMGYHNTTGNQGYRHLFYAMNDEGYADILHRMIVNPEYPGWGYMIACGAVSVWERWESEAKIEMNSFNHPMFGSYDGWFFNKLAGIDLASDAVAADTLIITPTVLSGLSFLQAEVKTLNGKVSSAWEKTAEGIVYTFALPYNVKTTVTVKGADVRIVEGVAADIEIGENKTTVIAWGGNLKLYAKGVV